MVTRHVARRMIDIVMEQEEIDQQAEQIHSDQFEGQQNISDDVIPHDLPDLVGSDDEDDEPTNIPSISSFQVNGTLYITPDMTNTHIFCDDHIMTLKSNGNVIPMSYVHRGPVYPTEEQLERWAAGDDGASDAIDQQEAIVTWEKHAKDSRVNKCMSEKCIFTQCWMVC